jgi:AraC-like DNA-binding protein
MPTHALDRLLRTLDVRLDAFGVCEIERGWRLSSSPMQSATLHYVLKGEGSLESDGLRVAIRPGDMIVVPVGADKSFTALGEQTREVAARDSCALRADGLASFQACGDQADLVIACAAVTATCAGSGLFDGLCDPLVETVEGSQPFQAAFALMLEEFSRPGPGGVVLAEALMKQCLVLMLRRHVERLGATSPLLIHRLDSRLGKAINLMATAPAASYTLSTLAQAAGMSRSAFASRFREVYGNTPFEFLQAVRLRAGARLLKSAELPVEVVASTVGYSSRSHFSRAFRAAYGVDPSGYRRA